MSRTNHHTNYRRANLAETHWQVSSGWDRGPDAQRIPYSTLYPRRVQVGNETWDLRFYAGCRRIPELVHIVVDNRGAYCSKLWLEPGLAKSAAKLARGVKRARDRDYAVLARKTWRAGEDVHELLEPEGRNRHSADWDLW